MAHIRPNDIVAIDLAIHNIRLERARIDNILRRNGYPVDDLRQLIDDLEMADAELGDLLVMKKRCWEDGLQACAEYEAQNRKWEAENGIRAPRFDWERS